MLGANDIDNTLNFDKCFIKTSRIPDHNCALQVSRKVCGFAFWLLFIKCKRPVSFYKTSHAGSCLELFEFNSKSIEWNSPAWVSAKRNYHSAGAAYPKPSKAWSSLLRLRNGLRNTLIWKCQGVEVLFLILCFWALGHASIRFQVSCLATITNEINQSLKDSWQ